MARSPLLYYITDRRQFAGDEPARCRQLLDKIAEAVDAGVNYIQLREKDLSSRELERLAGDAVAAVHKPVPQAGAVGSTKLLINSRTDVALAVNADGVHLRSEDVSPAEVRRIVQTAPSQKREPEALNFVVAVSCHSEEEVQQAAKDGADFVVFAPVFEKRDNPTIRPAGLDALTKICRYDVPVFALGGVTVDNAHSCLKAGAAGIAGIHLFQQNVIAEVVKALRK
jgi:thiamine-phosphate pyrophosphorylase